MIKHISPLSVIIFLLSISSCAFIKSSMPISSPNWNVEQYNQIFNDYSQIKDYVLNNAQYSIINTITYGSKNYELFEIYIDNYSDKDVLIFSGVHGDEPGSVQAVVALANNLDKIAGSKKYNIRIVPVVNPWGYEYNSRYNGNGIDINRDFANKKNESQEAKAIIQYYKDLDPYIVIDLHETNYDGDNYYYVYNKKMKKIMRDFISSNESTYLFEKNAHNSIYNADNGIIEIGKVGVFLARIADRWALSNFFLTKTNKVVVIESTMKNSMEDRMYFHLNSLQHILLNCND